MKLRIVHSFALCWMAWCTLSAGNVYLPLYNEQLVRAVQYVYFGLEDGGQNPQTYFLYANNGETSKAGDLTLNPDGQGNFAVHYCDYYPTYNFYRFPDLGHGTYKHCLGPTASAQAAYNAGNTEATSPGSYLVLTPLTTSTTDKARFIISTYMGIGDTHSTYYLSRTAKAVKWYTTVPQDQIALGRAVSSVENAGAWTVYITPETAADNITTTFYTGAHGTINSQTTYKRTNVTGIPWPNVKPRDGYMFAGWYSNSSLTGDEYISTHSTLGYYLPDHSTSLYARYVSEADAQVISWKKDAVQILYTGTSPYISTDQQTMRDLSHYKVDEGVYEIPLTDTLAQMAGQQIVITFHEQTGLLSGFKQITIPTLVTKSETDIPVTNHVVVLNGGTLTLTGNHTCETVHIYGGGKMVIPAAATLNVTSELAMYGGEYTKKQYYFRYPQLVANGAIHTPRDTIMYHYLISNLQYYSLSLPYDVQYSDIRYSDGTVADFGMQYYDGLARCQHNTGWADVTSTTLLAGQGHTVYAIPEQVNGVYQQYASLRFPMHVDLSNGETTQSQLSYKSVAVLPYGVGQANVAPNEAGWNLVGNPYLANYSNIVGLNDHNGIGILVLGEDGYSWQGNVRYVVIPNENGTAYLPQEVSRADLSSFRNFFVQIGQGDSLCFNLANRSQNAPMRTTEDMSVEELRTGITLANDQQIDYLGIVIGDMYTDQYDYNADLGKWNNQGLNLCAYSQQMALSYIAIPSSSMTIPVGYSTQHAGTYTFRFDDSRYQRDQVSAIYLTDNQFHKTVNLLEEDYSFTSGVISSQSRFSLQVVPSRVPTGGCINQTMQDNQTYHKLLRDGQIQIIRDGKQYNILGFEL